MVRILIVDDAEIMRIGLASLFSLETDLDVCGAAATGEQGVEVARQTHPDVVLMDIRMPGLDGVEATRRIVRELPRTQVVVLTGEPSQESKLAALEAGAAAYVVKDAVPATVLEAVRSAWNRAASGGLG
ncbi:response regulator transcription factor [Terrabacter sp. BE26]|uniref:response regulator n=1 Tax=Terrabacter sp. BE26 TaxID=2898152 RepID=UPI0035BE52F6